MALLIDQYLPTRRVRRHTSDKSLAGNISLYRCLRNKVIRSAKSIRQSYYREQLRSLRNRDPRRWWQYTKALTGLGTTSFDLHAMANSLVVGISALWRVKLIFFRVSL